MEGLWADGHWCVSSTRESLPPLTVITVAQAAAVADVRAVPPTSTAVYHRCRADNLGKCIV